ncbi:MAG TPA: branched-chain amino acid ABC transporter permease [Ktedonosporobacter sp.]|nr:branched-chain amino acid ABC transporter permease [Ktedonosporobacter sp.]
MQIYLILALTGLLWGGVYLLMATGLNLIYGVMKVVNLAHGDFIIVGGLLAFSLFTTFQISPWIALPIAAALLFGVGMLVHRLVLAQIDMAGSQGELRTLLATFGLSYIVSNTALLIWGGQYESIPFLQDALKIGPLSFPKSLVVCSGAAFVLALAVQLWLTRTASGRLVRATAQSELGAASCGLNIQRVRLFTFALGSAMAGGAGVLVVLLIPMQATTGSLFGVQAFILIVLGGLGNFVGAILAAVILGLVEVSTGYFFGANAASGVIYLIFILILMFRPQGLLGQRGRI